MSTPYVVISVVAAIAVSGSAIAALRRAKWVAQNLADYGVPGSWLPWLGTLKAAGAVGLVVGLVVPVIGLMAAIGLMLYFAGAVATVVRARFYSHVPYPLVLVAPVIAAVALRFST